MNSEKEKCRCGYDGTEEHHPCHGKGYCCRKPARQRFYIPNSFASLAGHQLKFSMRETWSCDECWDGWETHFLNPRNKSNEKI